jgi:hypothetical protein
MENNQVIKVAFIADFNKVTYSLNSQGQILTT